MSYLQLSLYSETLRLETNVQVILAADPAASPCLLLLHGASDNDTIWARWTSIERYANRYGISVVMPGAHLSAFADMRRGPAYETFLMRELPEFLHRHLGLPTARELNLIAGLSMGGYGALRLGLRHPERFSAIGCFSSGNLLVATGFIPGTSDPYGWISLVMGEDINNPALAGNPDFDLFEILAALHADAPLPRVYMACGRDDFLLNCSRMTAERLAAHPALPFYYEESHGAHDWNFWDRYIKHFLDWYTDTEKTLTETTTD